MIMAWLWNSMVPEISDTCMFLKSAKEIWEAVEQTYSKAKDAAQIYDVKVKTVAAKQGNRSVTEYANQLKSLWMELDHYRVIKAKCSEDSAILKEYIEQDRVYDFLVGLNPEYDQVRIQILGKEKVPGLNEVVAIIRSEESRRGLMLETSTTESSAMIAEGGTIMVANQRKNWVPSMEKKHEEVWCTHCNKPRHTREKCWKLHGKPPSREWGLKDGKTSSREWGPKGGPPKKGGQGQAYIANGQGEESVQLNHEEIERVRSILSKLEKPTDTPFTHYWILDSGATDHMTPLPKYFSTYSPCPSNKKISTADGTLITAAGQGEVQISPSMTLKNVLHVPKLSTNLISIQKLTKDLSCNVVFYSNSCILQDKNSGRTIGHAREWNGLYYMEDPNLPTKSLISLSTMTNKEKAQLYHCRLGHPSFRVIKVLFPSLFKNLNVESLHCEVCEFAKHKRVPFPISNKMSSFPFFLVHTDVWGPAHVPNISGAKWFLTFIDDCTRVTWVFLLKQKSEVSSVFVQFISMIKNQFGVGIKRIRSDNAKDYFNLVLNSFCQKEGIIHESSCVNTPQQNGIAERKNGHLLDQTRALLFQNHVPKRFWGEALLTATYLINRLPTKILNLKSPMEVLSSFYPHLHPTNKLQPRIFGCVSFVHVHSNERGKLDPRAVKCVFLGYSTTQKGYKCFHPISKRFYVSRDVTFNEQESYFKQPHLQGENVREEDETLMFPNMTFGPEIGTNGIAVPEIEGRTEPAPEPAPPAPNGGKFGKNLVYSRREKAILESGNVQESNPPSLHEVTPSNPINSNDSNEFVSENLEAQVDQTLDLPIALRKGTRTCTQQPLYPLSNFLSFEKFSPTHKTFLTNLNSTQTPSSVSEALSDSKWKHAMDVEMEALNKNRTWELVTLPPGKKPVGCKWVYAVKYRANGTIERYKARLVAKGFTQTYGVDYLETFAPVAKMNTVRVILSLAASYDWDLQQFDVKNAFLHGDLEEEIYMELPPGYNGQVAAGTVCKLRKALYGLKQSPRAWFGRFTKVMTSLGYKQSQGDHTLFIKHSVSGGVTILLVYVDDIIVSGDDKREQQLLSECLATEFEIKTLGRLKYFLGIEVAHSKKGIFISQQKYITDLLKETGKTGCRPASTPVDPNIKLGSMEEDIAVDKEMYQRLVGRLIYLSHTRPDIAFVVSLVSQFMHQPKEAHLQAALRIVQYLKGTPGRGILFKRNKSVSLEAYTDADYAGSVVDRRSTTGYCTFLGGNLVTWKSKKQSVVARSSAEAEFRAMAHGICELLWLKIILEDLKIKWDEPMRLYCDNKSAISIAHNPVQHDRTKHIEVDRHFIKEKLDSGMICTPYVSTQNQLADILTKGLNCTHFERIISKLGMENTYSPA
uniref:Retrovirus-related Pol polyprotein from transposon TNT 1-94 n=2 Tax=Cajanus cajan TaxID=3821 RepID=A0A151REJ2_CAJCA|nr:Retrovirus-related Pol polyprotein from transposon TNT 1-94 [Cajanus cajan]